MKNKKMSPKRELEKIKNITTITTKDVEIINYLLKNGWVLINIEPTLDGSGRIVYLLSNSVILNF